MKLIVGEKSYYLLDWREEYRPSTESEEEVRLNLTLEEGIEGLSDSRINELKSGLEKDEEKIIQDDEGKKIFSDGKRYKKIDRMTSQFSNADEKNVTMIIMKDK